MKSKSDRLSPGALALLVLVLAGAMLLCICVGSVSISPADTLRVLLCALLRRPMPEGVSANIILNVRLPRVVNVALVGAALVDGMNCCTALPWTGVVLAAGGLVAAGCSIPDWMRLFRRARAEGIRRRAVKGRNRR